MSALEWVGTSGGLSFVARVLLASVFVYSAISKTLRFRAAVAEVQGVGLRVPAVVTVLVILTQTIGATLLLIHRTVWLGATVLALFTLAATVLAHPFWRESGSAFTRELTTFLEHMGLIGGLVLAALVAHPNSPF